MRNPGRRSSQLELVPPVPIDCRNRPPPPERLSPDEPALWERMVLSRRPQWFLGSETLLETFVAETVACQRLEQARRRIRPGGSNRYVTLTKLHRESARLCASLATKLRLTPSRIDRNISRDGDRPLDVRGYGHQPPIAREPDEVSAVDSNGERSFERLRRATAMEPPPEPAPPADEAEPDASRSDAKQ